MKILLYTSSLNSGGRERQLVEFIKGLCNNHKDIILELAVMSHKIHYVAINSLNIKIHFLIRKNKKDPKIFIKLYKICQEFKPDIIHAWDSMAAVYAVPVVTKMGLRLINGMIRDAPPKLKPFGKAWNRAKLTFPFSDIIVANSHAGLESYKTPLNKCVCIHNGFDIQRTKIALDTKNIKKKFAIDTEKVVGMVASFSNRKDYKTFISFSQMILDQRDDLTCLAIGDGEKLEKCKKMVKSEFRKKFKFLGKQKDVESIINIFNIGVLATDTRFHGEGISNSIMEYMALRKPVVATDSGGTGELVINGKTGFLTRPLDVKDMYYKIKKILENNELAIKMGTAGKERIYKYFGLEKMTSSYVSLYKKILNER